MDVPSRLAAERAAAERVAAASTARRVPAEARAALEAGAKAGVPPAAPEAAGGSVSVLWAAFFELPVRSALSTADAARCPPNLHVCDDLSVGVDCDAHVERAQRIFERLYPGRPFLPSPDDDEEDEGGDATDGTADVATGGSAQLDGGAGGSEDGAPAA